MNECKYGTVRLIVFPGFEEKKSGELAGLLAGGCCLEGWQAIWLA